MKYNPDIALTILRRIEEYPSDEVPMKTNLLEEQDEETYYFHCRLLSEAGFISVYEVRTQGLDYYWPRQISWPGVQFLQMFDDQTLWERVKGEAISKGVGMALDTLMMIGVNLVKKTVVDM